MADTRLSLDHLSEVCVLLSLIGMAKEFLAVQWLILSTFTAVGSGSVPDLGTKILQAIPRGQKKIIGMANSALNSQITTASDPEDKHRNRNGKCNISF